MLMVLAKAIHDYSEAEMAFISKVVASICGAAVLLACIICLAYLAERRFSEWECRKRIEEETRLQRARNEVERERENYRLIDPELRSLVDYQKKVILEKDQQIYELKKKNDDYKRQLDEVKMGSFNGRSLQHVET